MKLIKFAAAALLALSSLSASAALISVVDSGSSEYAPDIDAYANNNFTTPGYVTPDSYTIAGSLKANTKLAVTYYYLGQESSWNNVFSVPGDAEAPLSLSNKGTITTYVEKDALFDFLFTTFVPPTSVNPRNYKNASTYRIGTQYKASEKFTVRAGYYFDESPVQDGYFAPETPRNDSMGYTGGLTYQLNSKLGIDFSFLYLHFDEVDNSYDYVSDGSSFVGTYKSVVFSPVLVITYFF